MKSLPYATSYINEVFSREERRLDYRLLRPLLLVLSFFLRSFLFPIKFVFHRRPYGFESRCIDGVLAFGMKYFASADAVDLMVRHVQIEPLLYRYFLKAGDTGEGRRQASKLNGIDGDFNLASLSEMILHNLTIGHDELSYELLARFDRKTFLDRVNELRRTKPEDHHLLDKSVLEVAQRHSLQWIGCTNVVIFIVLTITLFADLRTAVKALNSFDSDSLILWASKILYANDPVISTDLDFYLPDYSNRTHFNTSVFFANPSLYLQNHIALDEYVYETLNTRPPHV